MKPQAFKPLQTQRLDLKPLVASFDFANKLFDIISRINCLILFLESKQQIQLILHTFRL